MLHPPSTLASCGERTVVESGAMIICPEAVHVGTDVTVAALALLDGSPEGELRVGDRTLIGPHSYVQGLGGVRIGSHVGVGARVLMLTAVHPETPPGTPITDAPLRYGTIEIGDGCDIGVGGGGRRGDG
jgi:acetyltransferase-like isoleucine patch superfamily enzyme